MPYYGLEPETLSNTTQSLPVPVGSVMAFLSTTLPTGFIICDGRTIQKTAPLDPDYYPQLVDILNPGQTTATVPDLRGQFLRGHSIDNSVDPDGPRTPGDSQTDEIEAHTHDALWKYQTTGSGSGGEPVQNAGAGNSYVMTTTNQQPPGVTETRPKNIAVVWGIKASDTVINSTLYSEVDPSSLFRQVVNSQKDQFNGRLSISNTDPFATGTGTTLYLLPYNGNSVWLYNISKAIWERYSIPGTPPSLALTGLTAFLPYDVFVYDSGGNLTLERVAWTNATTRATTLTTQDGVYVKSGEVNKRFVGTFYPIDATTVQIDSGSIDVSYNAGYYNDIKHIGLANHYNVRDITINLLDYNNDSSLQNAQLMFTTPTVGADQLIWATNNPNISKFEYASTGISNHRIDYSFITNIYNAGAGPGIRIAIVNDYSWVSPTMDNTVLALLSGTASATLHGALTITGSEVPTKGYNTYAIKGRRFSNNINAYQHQSWSFKGVF